VPQIDLTSQRVHVADRGAGDALVFLHAFPLQAAMWDYQVDAFEGTHRCITIDLPGFGGSEEPVHPESASMQGYADLVVGALDELGIDKATVVGASMGGYLVMALLRRHPDRVSQVVLAGTKARSDDAAAVARRTDQQDQVRNGAEVASVAKGVVEALLSSGSMGRPDLVEYVHALAGGVTPGGWIAALEAMKGRDDSMLVLRQAGVRSLVVVGELDRVTPIADAMSLRSMLKGELVVIPGVGHLPNLEDPYAFNDALAAFLGVTPGDLGDAAGEDAIEAGQSEADSSEDAPEADAALEADAAPEAATAEDAADGSEADREPSPSAS
jgi:pimeloyl-ACP methyl ester carboxylesterase